MSCEATRYVFYAVFLYTFFVLVVRKRETLENLFSGKNFSKVLKMIHRNYRVDS